MASHATAGKLRTKGHPCPGSLVHEAEGRGRKGSRANRNPRVSEGGQKFERFVSSLKEPEGFFSRPISFFTLTEEEIELAVSPDE